MTTFVYDEKYLQGSGDTSLTAPPNSPNLVFLNNTGAQGFAGLNGSTDYIVLGNAAVFGSNSSPDHVGIAWQPGDEIQITFQIFAAARVSAARGYAITAHPV
jgi:hypothetical protein